MYFGQLLSDLPFIAGLAFSKAQGGQSSQHCNIFAGLRWPIVERQSSLACTSFNMEEKRKNGDSQDLTFVLLGGLILKTCLCYHPRVDK